MNFLTLTSLTADLLPAAIALDRQCFGGLWSLEGYQRELESPYSDLLVLQQREWESDGVGEKESGREESSSIPSLPHYPLTQLPRHPITPSPLLGLGCLWAILEEAHITVLAIHPDYHQQGLGQLLLYSLIVAAWRRRLEWLTLEVGVSNQAAIALYQKFGFETVGKRRNYYPKTGEDALILWRKGLQSPEFGQILRIRYQEVCDRLSQAGWCLSPSTTKSQIDHGFLEMPLDVGPLS